MRKTVILIAAVATALVLASGIAYAKSFVGTSKDDIIVGTSSKDTIAGGGKNDTISGKGGNDRLYGDSGADEVFGNRGNDDIFGGKGADDVFGGQGNDYINIADNRGGDFADCGTGDDTLVVDAFLLSESEGDFETAGILEPVSSDDFVNCEDVTFVFPNPDTGSHSDDEEEELPNMNEAEVQKAIDNGTLIEIK